MKLLEYNIKTSQVYVNIISGESVSTETLSTDEAIKKYGQLNVISVDEPEVEMVNNDTSQFVDVKRSKRKTIETVKRFNGITNFVLQ